MTIPAEMIERARSVPVENVIAGHGIKLRGTVERSGPCPHCGGEDRFSINVREQVFNCRGCGAKGDVIALVRHLDGCDFSTAIEKLSGEKVRQASGGLGPIKAVYDYTDEAGKLLFQVLRFEPPDRPKEFRQRTGPNQKPWSVEGVRIAPFRLPEVIEALALGHPVFVVEGEKDVLTLAGLGVPATTNPMGAGKWREQFNEYFGDADIVVCGDNDKAGRAHVDLVARNLHSAARRVRVLDLAQFWPDIAKGDDISDWLAKGGGTVEKLYEIVDGLTSWKPINGEAGPRSFAPIEDEAGVNAEGDPDRQRPPRFPLVAFRDVLMPTTSYYLVKNLIPRWGLVVVWGPPKCGKSFWVFDLLMHPALGWEYRGLRVKQGYVVYCALEGTNGFKNRIEAFRSKRPGSNDAQLSLMFTPLDLIRDRKALIESVRAQLPEGARPFSVVIDTLNRSLVGSESKDEDMGAYVRAADAIRDAFDCVVIIIHHCGHNADRPRGHSSLLGAADVQIAVKRDASDNIVATVELAKDGPIGLEFVSQLVVVDLGLDDDGDAITSCIVEPVGEASIKKAATSAPKLTKGAKNALRALHMALGELGEIPPASSHIPAGVRTVTVKQWRDCAFKTGISTSDKPHAASVAFNRASEALLAANKIGIWEPYVWPVFEKEK